MTQDVLSALSDLTSDSSASTAPLEDVEGPSRAKAGLSDRGHTFAIIGIDFVGALVALPLSLVILANLSTASANSLSHFRNNLVRDVAFPCLVVLGLSMSGLYGTTRHALRPSILRYSKDLVFAIGTGFMLAVGLGVVVHAVIHVDEPSATQLLLAVPIAGVLIIAGRAVLSARANAYAASRVLVVGSGALAERIAVCLHTWNGMEFVGRVTPDGCRDTEAIGHIADLPELCDRLSIDRVIIGFPDEVNEESIARLRHLQERIHISVVPRYFDLMSFHTKLVDLSGIPMLEMAPRKGRRAQLLLKRAFDILASLLALLILSPLFVVVAFAVAVSSPGPILFQQNRTGYRGKLFIMYKFRTMAPIIQSFQDPENEMDNLESTSSGDPNEQHWFEPLHVKHRKQNDQGRLTRVGRFLRTSGLDELPQFLNVLKGDMSIVGPRPLVPEECSDLKGWHSRRFDMHPGITGLWQVSGRNDLTESDLYILDYVYVSSWSMWWDVKIVFETPRAMLHGFGAY